MAKMSNKEASARAAITIKSCCEIIERVLSPAADGLVATADWMTAGEAMAEAEEAIDVLYQRR
jgi:hypothetical protein